MKAWVQTSSGLLGAFLLVPAVFAFYSFYEALFFIVVPVFVNGGGNAAVIAGAISELLIRQVAACIACVPGLVIWSVLVFKLKYDQKWFKLVIKSLAAVMLFTLPFMFLLGVYALCLSMKSRSIA